jgi:hypothetical protein
MKNFQADMITLKEASKLTPYSAEYLGLLIRKEKLEGYKKNGMWFTTETAVKKYLQRAAEYSYEHQQNINVKIPAAELKQTKTTIRWVAVLLAVIIFFGLFIWKIKDDNRNANIREKYRLTEDKDGNITLFADDPAQVKSVKVMKKE